LLIFVFTEPCPPSASAQDDPYVAEILTRSKELRLHEEREWRLLLHYQKAMFGYKSLIDDPKFFLAPDGHKNPRSELEATIRGFFQTEPEGDEHPLCRFPLRYEWLKSRLGIDPERLPKAECPRLKNVTETIKPESSALIFPTSHINSPASMFGHTLLTFNSGIKSPLLSHAINYSAVTNETFGPLYAIKGLLGYYPGYFSILPYYAKIQEYSDFDHRDIWEYHLNLNESELKRMLLHIFELESIYSDYYFFGENCSYNLMYLFDVARPSLTLTDRFYKSFPFWVIPIDTVRGVRESGVIEKVEYRPSRSSMIQYIASHLSGDGRKLAVALARGKKNAKQLLASDYSEEDKIRILDLASEYTQYRYSKEYTTKEEYSKTFIALLQARSALGKPEISEYTVPPPVNPEDGHLSARASMGTGLTHKEGKTDYYQQMRVRPAYHSLLDRDSGYVEGGQIVFIDITFRYYDIEKRFELNNIDLIDISSISPRDELFKSVSWKINTGLTRLPIDEGRDPYIFHLSPGGGFALKPASFCIVYAMFESEADLGKLGDKNYSLGLGASAGIMLKIKDYWKMHLYGREIAHLLGEKRGDLRFSAAQSFYPSTNTAITLEYVRKISGESYTPSLAGDVYRDELGLNFNLFF